MIDPNFCTTMSCMSKTAVYSWRLSPELKLALAEVARQNRESIAELLERIVEDWLESSRSPVEEEAQRRLHAEASKYVGSIDGGDPERATGVRQRVRARLARHRERLAG